MAPKVSGMPSTEVMSDWLNTDASLRVVATWAGVEDAVLDEFCNTVGTTAEEPLINASYFSPEETAEVIDGLIVDGEPIKLIAKAKLRRMAAVIQLAVHDPEPEVTAGAPEGATCSLPMRRSIEPGRSPRLQDPDRLPQPDRTRCRP